MTCHDCYEGSRLAEYDRLGEPGYDSGHRCMYPDRGPIDTICIDSDLEAYLYLTPDGSGVTLALSGGDEDLGWVSPTDVEGLVDDLWEALGGKGQGREDTMDNGQKEYGWAAGYRDEHGEYHDLGAGWLTPALAAEALDHCHGLEVYLAVTTDRWETWERLPEEDYPRLERTRRFGW